MLVLSRDKWQSVVIRVPPSTEPTEIVVAVVDVRGGDYPKARLGFEAPKETVIHRREVWDAIQAEHNGKAVTHG